MIEEKFDYDKEMECLVKLRQTRNDYGACPAQREYSGETCCSRPIPCDEYSAEGFVYDKETDMFYHRCKFIERDRIGHRKI